MDTYRSWLQEQVAYYRNLCLDEAKAAGWNGSQEYEYIAIKYAHPENRAAMDTYEECLDKFNELAAQAPAPPDDGIPF